MGKYSEAVAPQKAMVICQLLHFPAHSWSVLFQHSWLSPFLLPLCKWPARSLSWKEFRMGSGKHQGWHKGANKDKWEAASITPLKPWHASNTNACKYTGGWTRCPPEGPLPQPFCDVFQSIKSISFRRNRRIIQSMSRKWVHFLISSGSKQDTTEHTWTLRSPKI